jgi:hypothetical protein
VACCLTASGRNDNCSYVNDVTSCLMVGRKEKREKDRKEESDDREMEWRKKERKEERLERRKE